MTTRKIKNLSRIDDKTLDILRSSISGYDSNSAKKLKDGIKREQDRRAKEQALNAALDTHFKR